eukprot:TRINITY_DN66974_c6_g2_i1.p1 TRINITY_DN66974_c6_g2~~TRINITY_DN66974_c6_g2_i1.p1  ORF type:complete len:832 (+),score=125.90 TRINITY_DN66974_c6_g2_i1:130-2625(+)
MSSSTTTLDPRTGVPLIDLPTDAHHKFPCLREAHLHYYGYVTRNNHRVTTVKPVKETDRILLVTNNAIFFCEEATTMFMNQDPLQVKRAISLSALQKLWIQKPDGLPDEWICIQVRRGPAEGRLPSDNGPDVRFKLKPPLNGTTPQGWCTLVQTLYKANVGMDLKLEDTGIPDSDMLAKLQFNKDPGWSPPHLPILTRRAVANQWRQQQQWQQQQTQVADQINPLQTRVEQLQSAQTHVQDENTALHEQITKLRQDLEERTTRLNDLSLAKEELEKQTAQASANAGLSKEEFEELTSKKERLEHAVENLETTNKKLQDQVIELKGATDDSSRLLPGVEQLKTANVTLEDEKRDLQETVARLRDELDKVTCEKEELHNQPADVTTKESEELIKCKNQIEKLQADLTGAAQTLLKTQEAMKREKDESRAQIDRLQESLDNTDQELAKAKMVMDRVTPHGATPEIHSLRTTLENKDLELEQLRRSLENSKLGNTHDESQSQGISNVFSTGSSQPTPSKEILDDSVGVGEFVKPEKPPKTELATLKHALDKKDKQLSQTKGVLREAFKRQVEELETIRKQFQQYDDQIVSYLERVFNTSNPNGGTPPPPTQPGMMYQHELGSPLVSPVPYVSPSYTSAYGTTPPPTQPIEAFYYPPQGPPTSGPGALSYQAGLTVPPLATPHSPSPSRMRGGPTSPAHNAFANGGGYSYYNQAPVDQYYGSSATPTSAYSPPPPAWQMGTGSSGSKFTRESAGGKGGVPQSQSGHMHNGPLNSGQTFTPIHPAAGVAVTVDANGLMAGSAPLSLHQQPPPVQASPIRKGMFSSQEDTYHDPESVF